MKKIFWSLYAFVYSLLLPTAMSGRKLDPAAGANVYSDLYNSLYVNSPPAKVTGKSLGGRIRIFRSTYTQGAADGAIGDVVMFGKLPQGAQPLPFGYATFTAGNAGATLSYGLAANSAGQAASAAYFGAATSIAAIGTLALTAFAASAAVGQDMGADTDVTGTNAVAAIKAGQKVTVWIPYVLSSD